MVLKIRRPGIRAKIDADLRILFHIAELIESEIPEARRYLPVEIAGHFARSLERELDLAGEARNVERFAKHFEGDPYIVIPKIYPEWTSETLNVQEYVAGIPGTDLAAVKAAGLDPKLLAARGAEAILKMILVDGFFHADPHPGNVFYLPGNRIVMIDCGMVGGSEPAPAQPGRGPPRRARAHGRGRDARRAARLGGRRGRRRGEARGRRERAGVRLRGRAR